MATNEFIQSPEEFRLEQVLLRSDRFEGDVNLKNISIEFNVFENIHYPYLTGSLIILDDNQLYDQLQIQGTERIDITISLGDRTDQIEKSFVITQVAKTFKTNDYSAVLQFDLIEDIGYLNNITKFSKMYDGKCERIIEKVVKDNIRRPIANIDESIGYPTFRESFQQRTRYLVPYITPFNVVQLMLDKMSTTHACPYYFYSTLVNNNLFLADLETILERNPFNQGNPFIFSQSQSNARSSQSFDQQSYSIYNVEQPNVDDTLLLAEMGGIYASYSVYNALSGETYQDQTNIFVTIDRLRDAGVIPDGDVVPLDQQFIPDPTGINPGNLINYPARFFDEVTGNTYPYSDEITNWTDESGPEFKLRAEKYSLEQLLLKNTQRITVPGFRFLVDDPQTSVGNQIELNIFKNDPESENVLDPKRSGNFVMAAKRHTFNITEYKHLCTIECVRLTYPEVA